MNYFEYRIYSDVYDEMVSGKKNIEFRLSNEKSEKIKIGDEIKFIVFDNANKFLLVEVTNKYVYDNLDDLWTHKEVLNNTLNYSKEEFSNVFYKIFGKEKVECSRIIGIEFKVKEVVDLEKFDI